MEKHYKIRQETPADFYEVEKLTREAFWNVYRPGCMEHYVLHRYRTMPGFIPSLSLCLLADDEIIAHIMYAQAEIHSDAGEVIPILTFGPLSVRPDCQGNGVGSILLDVSMKKAKEYGAKALAITGHLGFYGRHGFVVASTKGIHYYAVPKEDEAPFFLIKELEDGFLDGKTGTYTDPAGYDCEGADIDAFDAQFPPKEKLKLPGQLM